MLPGMHFTHLAPPNHPRWGMTSPSPCNVIGTVEPQSTLWVITKGAWMLTCVAPPSLAATVPGAHGTGRASLSFHDSAHTPHTRTSRMSGIQVRPLAARLPGWPDQAPQFLPALLQTRFLELKQQLEEAGCTSEQVTLVLEMRRDVIDAKRSSDELPIHSPAEARRMLEDRVLWPQAGKWVVYDLDANRTRRVRTRSDGAREYVRTATDRVPTAEALATTGLPEGGTHLVVYGGGPEVLDHVGVAEALAALRDQAPVADVLFWHLQSGTAPTLYSLLAGCGDRAGRRIEFPNPQRLEAACGKEAT
jgi:hypothetical protein